MDHVVARQPILSRENELYAYELLFRSGLDNIFPEGYNTDLATMSILSDAFFSLGLQDLTDGNLAFINFTYKLLVDNVVEIFPRESLVVEILEDVPVDGDLISAIRKIKKMGYRIALDDFCHKDPREALFQYADIVKVDFKITTREQQQGFVELFEPYQATMLAEKVEDYEDVSAAKDMGYDLFQGYYFCKPILMNRSKIPENKLSKLELLKEANREEADLDAIERIIKHDLELSYKLLKYSNSAMFGFRNEIANIRQALVVIGQSRLRKWSAVLAVTCLGENKPSELIMTSIIRGRLCELLAEELGFPERSNEMFLMGLFSLLDVLLDVDIQCALKDIPLAKDMKAALRGKSGTLKDILDFAKAFESGNWDVFEKKKHKLEIKDQIMPSLHLDALRTAKDILQIHDEP